MWGLLGARGLFTRMSPQPPPHTINLEGKFGRWERRGPTSVSLGVSKFWVGPPHLRLLASHGRLLRVSLHL